MTSDALDPGPSIGVVKDKDHQLGVRVYYEDTDFTGVVYHAGYLRFMERGRSEFLRLIEAEAAPGLAGSGAFAVTRIEVDYRAPARIHDVVMVRTRLAEIRGPRLVFRQSVERGDETLCVGVVTAVPILPDGRARRPSREEIALWSSFLHA